MSNSNPKVAIVGRINVGKSTLFNRLIEQPRAITSQLPGTTRDRHYAPCSWQGINFILIDTGGLDEAQQNILEKNVIKQANQAIQEASVIIFLTDGRIPPLPQDKEIAKSLRRTTKPVILAINKVDSPKIRAQVSPDYYRLGLGEPQLISAASGIGTGDLLDQVTAKLPAKNKAKRKIQDKTSLAIIGKPNVGKSTFINALLGQERVLVSDTPHTTRDTQNIEFNFQGKDLTLVDTAGIRKKSRVGQVRGVKLYKKEKSEVEKESVHRSLRAIKEADIVIFITEVQQSITSQDKKLARLINKHKKPVILVVNKWDLVKNKDYNTFNKFIEYFQRQFPHLGWAPIIFISATEKKRVHKVLELALSTYEKQSQNVDEKELEKIATLFNRKYFPPAKKKTRHGKQKVIPKILRIKQTKTGPPEFTINVKSSKPIPEVLVKTVEKRIREKYEFEGIPISVVVKMTR